MAGVPDLRVFPDPWIDLEGDREKARRLAASTDGRSLEESVRAYWAMTPGTPGDRAERFVRHVLSAGERSREWLAEIGEANGVPRREEADRPLLDLGCGTGDLAAALVARGSRAVVGADIALRWLMVAGRRRGISSRAVRLTCCCAEALPYPDGSFAGVLSLGLLAHCRDPARVLEEAHRVLQPGGFLALRTANRYTVLREPHVGVWGVGFLPRRWADPYVRWRGAGSYAHHRPLSVRELGGLLRRAGFRDVRVGAARFLAAEGGRLGPRARRLAGAYEKARRVPLLGRAVRWVAPLLEASGRRPG